jgi:hypothetical protein
MSYSSDEASTPPNDATMGGIVAAMTPAVAPPSGATSLATPTRLDALTAARTR